MNAYPDTSFMVSLYVYQSHTEAVRSHLTAMTESLHVGSLLRYEVCHAIRRMGFLRMITEGATVAALAAFDDDIDQGRVVIHSVDWEQVFAEAEQLSHAHETRRGYRAFDVLHVATALTLGAQEFLTFDRQQAELAQAVGLKVQP